MQNILSLYTKGIVPSSSHTNAPMSAACDFINLLSNPSQYHIEVDIFGSLALTGVGHGTPAALVYGLMGHEPETACPDAMSAAYQHCIEVCELHHQAGFSIQFDPKKQIIFNYKDLLPLHVNGMRFRAYCNDSIALEHIAYSIGGGFVVHCEHGHAQVKRLLPFDSFKEIKAEVSRSGLSLYGYLVRQVDLPQLDDEINNIWQAMRGCVERGLAAGGVLPGGLNVQRRAAKLFSDLSLADNPESSAWLSAYAMAVNEENAAGQRVVTAPTNGSSGLIPACLYYYEQQRGFSLTPTALRQFFVISSLVGHLCKQGASISGAEVGCQGEVGVACAMASAGLVAMLGGNDVQIERAAEMAIEHHLGLTCDPINGLVQIPCIERNAVGAAKAVHIANWVLLERAHQGIIDLDTVIATMRKTGADMLSQYKETSQGGLAVAYIEC